ncbi:MAG: hypothetical protein KKH41_04090 [Candidatus Thermoplasmatota archaeon]|nr:hypothetical protein [Euryarchaeota archaeon]MBU4032583.1 hypothetical protein [Candidatus Thermoplasmatota archaeon]MBU4070952.1 hypothetical protein [Candidatus Thermoplasmatota archaeon]MBU4144156.1 hypothetical protein [Candidatus Thermoplasmatota archaeon]MBU4591748.1 hypothetical protein [Candidatus Thermoplasmatota archaeon]
MMAILAVLVYGFIMGLRKGASSCLALCMPSLVPAIIEDGRDWKSGAKIALWFNAPRMLFLTLLGGAVGAGGFLVGSSFDVVAAGSGAWAVGYLIIGVLMFIYGIYVFARTDEKLGDIADGKVLSEDCRPHHPLFSRLKLVTPRSRPGLLLWGGIVSIACIGETVLSLETLFVGFSLTSSNSPFEGALLGGLAFFLFSLGASLPSIVFAGLGSSLASREKRMERLLQFQRMSGFLMIMFGAIFVATVLLLL